MKTEVLFLFLADGEIEWRKRMPRWKAWIACAVTFLLSALDDSKLRGRIIPIPTT